MINERSNLLPAKARANSLSLVKLGSKASSDWGAHQCGLDEVSPAVSYVGIFPSERSENAESVNEDREEEEEENSRESRIWSIRINSFEYSALLGRIRRVEVHYASVKHKPKTRERKHDYEQTKVRSGASLEPEKPQNSGLLVNIKYLVSYPIGRNVSEKKEVRAKLPLYRISQSR